MSQTVFNESNQIFVDPFDRNISVFVFHFLFENLTIFGIFCHQTVDSRNCQFHDFEVCFLVVSTNVVHFSVLTFTHNEVDCFAVVFHIKPVAHIATVTVDREMLSFEDILDNQRNQFFREVVRTVVVGATGNRYRHFISVVVSHYHHVCTCLRSTVWAVRTKRSCFSEIPFGSQ